MRKSKKILSVTLALIMVLGVMVIGVPTMTAGAAGGAASVSLKSTAYNSNATVTIGWQKGSGGATGFQIAKKKLGDKSYSYFYVGGGNTKSYNDKSVVCGTIYYYQVRTVYKVGKNTNYGAWSNSKTITTLYRPTITSMNYISYNLNINWNSIKGVSHYRLAFKRTTDKAWNYRDVKNRYYNVKNPTYGATYVVQVCPMNGSIAGQWSAAKSLLITIGNIKPQITHTVGDNIYNRIIIEWSFPMECPTFFLYYKKAQDSSWTSEKWYTSGAGGDYSESNNISTFNCGCRISDAEEGTTYYIQLRVCDKYGHYSNYSSVSTCRLKTNADYNNFEANNSIVDEAAFGNEDNITLKVWVPDKSVRLVEKQVEDFKKAYPNKTFKKIEVVGQGESDAVNMIFGNPSGLGVDVFSFYSDQLDGLAYNGVISPVQFSNYVSKNNDESMVNAATINNKLCAYPKTNDIGYCLVYDKRVVSSTQARTLEGVLAACKAKGKKFIFNCSYNGFFSCAFAFTAGVKPDGFEGDGITQKFTKYNEDEAVATLQAFSKLMHDYKGTFESIDNAEIASGFKTGSVGAGVDDSRNYIALKKALGDNFGVAKLPTINVNGQAKQMVPIQGYTYTGVNIFSKFPASAQILALYLSGEKCQRENAEQLGYGPSNKNVQQEPVVTENPVLCVLKEQSAYAVPQVDINQTLWYHMGNLGNDLIADNTDPNDATYFRNLLRQTVSGIRDNKWE